MDVENLLQLHEEPVRAEWIDANGHMNLAYYVLAFDHATDALFDRLGIGNAYRQASGHALFVAETHLTYERELKAGDPMRFTSQLLGVGAKKLHLFHAMYHAEAGFLAATNELLGIHVDLARRRAAPFPNPVFRNLAAMAEAHGRLGRPKQAGRAIALDRQNG
jgi:acyl-CoA thioester hydrolase